MKRFFAFLLLLACCLGVGWIVVRQSPGRLAQTVPETLPSLPKPPREYRLATLGRPVELPLRALLRMPELQGLPVRFIACQTPSERWLMLASGQVDALIASSDELALALPRFELETRLFPLAHHQGNEQIIFSSQSQSPPLIAFLPGGISEGLALNLKDSSLRSFPVSDPEKALEMLASGQVRGAGLWNPWREKALAQGGVARADSTSFEVWVSARGGESLGRLQPEDTSKVVRAWFDLMNQFVQQPELTQRAIAQENEISPERVSSGLSGLHFYSASKLVGSRQELASELSQQMRNKVNLWSLSGQPVVGDIQRLQVDLSWLDELGLAGEPVTSPPTSVVPVAPETPGTTEPTSSPSPPADPFARGLPDLQRQAGGDAGRSGRLPGPAVFDAPKLLWASALGAEITTSAVASSDGKQIFVGCADGNLASLEAQSGRLMWKHSLGERIRSAPSTEEGMVWAASDSGQIKGLQRDTGEVVWVAQASSDIVGPLCLIEERLVAASLDGKVYCLNKSTGEELWQAKAGGNITAGTAAQGNQLIVCSVDQKVRSLALDTGNTLWTANLGGACRSTPCIDEGLVILGCGDSKIYALKLHDGSRAWAQKLPDEVICAPVSLQHKVFVGCKDNAVHCLDRGTGKPLWNYPTRERITNDLVAAEGVIYACSQDMRLYALSPKRELLFKHKEDSWLETPWVEGKTIYLPTHSGNLKALR